MNQNADIKIDIISSFDSQTAPINLQRYVSWFNYFQGNHFEFL